jgi:hypothetical protein
MSTESADEIKEDSARKAHYDDLWDRTPSAKVTVDSQETTEYFRVFWKSNSESENLPVKEIPIDSDGENGLWYNADNSRILAYKKKKEAELLAVGENRKLSSANNSASFFFLYAKILELSALYHNPFSPSESIGISFTGRFSDSEFDFQKTRKYSVVS